MVGGHPGEGVLCATGREAADRGNEPEQEVLDDEDPHEHADDGADLVAHDRPEADADPAPERGRRERAEPELDERTPTERAVDPSSREDAETDREREPLADQRKNDPRKQARDVLGRDHDPAARREHERRPDRPKSVLARDDQDPREGGEEGGEAADTEEVPLIVRGGQVFPARQEAGQQDEQQHEREQAHDQPDRRPRRPDLQELGADLVDHWISRSAVSSRKTSSSEDASFTSSCRTTPPAAATSPTRSLVVPRTNRTPSVSVASIPSRANASRSAPACGERTRTDPPTRAVSWPSVDSTMIRPRLMIRTRSTVCATSASTWLDTSTVRPPAANERRKSRSQRTPSGSSPFAGSSRTSSSGSPSNAAASPSRCRMPSE